MSHYPSEQSQQQNVILGNLCWRICQQEGSGTVGVGGPIRKKEIMLAVSGRVCLLQRISLQCVGKSGSRIRKRRNPEGAIYRK